MHSSQIGPAQIMPLESVREEISVAVTQDECSAFPEIQASTADLSELLNSHHLTNLLMQYSKLSGIGFLVSEEWLHEREVPQVLLLNHKGFSVADVGPDRQYFTRTHAVRECDLTESRITMRGLLNHIQKTAEQLLGEHSLSFAELNELEERNLNVRLLMSGLGANGDSVDASGIWAVNDCVRLRLVLTAEGFKLEVFVRQSEHEHEESESFTQGLACAAWRENKNEVWQRTLQPVSQHDLLLCHVTKEGVLSHLAAGLRRQRAA